MSPQLSQFISSFIQALLKTGYYTPNHPDALRTLKSLYSAFQVAVRGRHELTFLTPEAGETQDVLIDGLFDEPVTLSRVLMQGMADLYAPKMRVYFDSRGLVQLTLKAALTADEFQTFVEVMTAPPGQDERDRITRALCDGGVIHVSTVFRGDLVAHGRILPWRVEVALSRLKRDLQVIPLYRTLTPDQKGQMKPVILDDIVRPIRPPDLLMELLVNADLIGAAVQEASHLDLDTYLVGVLPPPLIRQIADEGLKEYDRLHDPAQPGVTGQNAARRERIQAMLSRFASVLAPMGQKDDLLFIRHLFDRSMIGFDFLPPSLKEQVTVERLADEFLVDPARALRMMRETDGNAYAQAVTMLVRIAPELIRRRQYYSLRQEIEFLDEARQAPQGSAAEAGNRGYVTHLAREQLTSAENVRLLVETIRASRMAPNEAIEILVGFGKVAAAPLIELTTDETAGLREAAVSVLVRLGEPALGAILDGLRIWRGDRQRAKILLTLIRKIGVRRADVLRMIELDATHPHAEVRAEALTTLATLQGAEAEPYLLKALEDSDPRVQEAAVTGLGQFRCVKRPVIAYFVRVLEQAEAPEAEEELQVAVCRAIRDVAPALSAEATARLESALREVVRGTRRGGPSWIARLFGQRYDRPERVKTEARLSLDCLKPYGIRQTAA